MSVLFGIEGRTLHGSASDAVLPGRIQELLEFPRLAVRPVGAQGADVASYQVAAHALPVARTDLLGVPSGQAAVPIPADDLAAVGRRRPADRGALPFQRLVLGAVLVLVLGDPQVTCVVSGVRLAARRSRCDPGDS